MPKVFPVAVLFATWLSVPGGTNAIPLPLLSEKVLFRTLLRLDATIQIPIRFLERLLFATVFPSESHSTTPISPPDTSLPEISLAGE